MALGKAVAVVGGGATVGLGTAVVSKSPAVVNVVSPAVKTVINQVVKNIPKVIPRVINKIFDGAQDEKNKLPKAPKVNVGKQNKHIQGTNNYNQEVANGKKPSILNGDPQQLLDNRAGTGQHIPNTNKERVNFGEIIGQYYDIATGKYVDTTNGIIHYDDSGSAHIVPAKP